MSVERLAVERCKATVAKIALNDKTTVMPTQQRATPEATAKLIEDLLAERFGERCPRRS